MIYVQAEVFILSLNFALDLITTNYYTNQAL